MGDDVADSGGGEFEVVMAGAPRTVDAVSNIGGMLAAYDEQMRGVECPPPLLALRRPLDQAVGSGDSRLLIRLNCQFLDTITHIAGNSGDRTASRPATATDRLVPRSVIANWAPSSWVEHREILAELEDHDAALASSLMLQHIHPTLDRIDLRQP